MMVNGPLEIYATVIGVKTYDALFNILASFGIAYIPLLVIFFSGISLFFERSFSQAGDASLKQLAFNLFGYVFGMMFFVTPTHSLDLSSITYEPVCVNKTFTSSKFGDTGTTYDKVFDTNNFEDIKIPLGLELFLTGMSGITNAAIVSLPCKTDVQAIKNVIITSHLTPVLAQQVQRFEKECFAPARAKFDAQPPEDSAYSSIMRESGGQSDLSWIGSHVFLNLYYPDMYPKSPVQPFQYTDYQSPYDQHNQNEGMDSPEYGFPSCSEWWSNSENGLQARLVKLVNDHDVSNEHLGKVSLTARVESWLNTIKSKVGFGNKITPADIITHSLLYDTDSQSGFGRSYAGWMDDSLMLNTHHPSTGDVILSTASHIGASVGQGTEATFNAFKRNAIAQEIPILQAVVLALCLALGPVVLILGRYKAHVIFTYYFLLGSVLSITFVEKFIHYLEVSLHTSMSYGLYALGNNFMMYNVFTNLYLYAPIIYLMLMSIAGVKAGEAVRGVFNNSSSDSGSSFVRGLTSKITRG